MTSFLRPELLRPDHEVAQFDCGSEDQTVWLRRHALQAQQVDSARVYVVSRSGRKVVVGYYALAAGSVAHDSVSTRVGKGLGRHPIPVVLLTRLGVDLSEQGKSLGLSLVQDALLQTAAVAERVGVRALLIHAETPTAAAFYRRISPAFQESPTDPLHLILLMKDLRSAISEAAQQVLGRMVIS